MPRGRASEIGGVSRSPPRVLTHRPPSLAPRGSGAPLFSPPFPLRTTERPEAAGRGRPPAPARYPPAAPGLTCLSLRLRQLLLGGRDGFCSFAGHFWGEGEPNRPGLAGAPDSPRATTGRR